MKKTKKFLPTSAKAHCLIGLVSTFSPLIGAVTPGGSFADKALISIDNTDGGETVSRATSAGGIGPAMVHDFNVAATDGSYEHNPTAADATQIALSSGRHLVLYNTRFDDNSGTANDRSEVQSYLTLAGSPLVAGRSQGFIRRNGGADEAVMSGGAIITVAADDDIMTLETRRSDNDTNTVLPFRVAGQSAIQLLKLDDSWDYLSAQRSTNQGGDVSTAAVDVTYDVLDATSSLGSAFSFTPTSGNVTLNETGLYLVFANTSLQKATNNTRTNFQQSLTLDGSIVPGSRTTTYVRGNEDTNEGMAAIGMIVSATAGQILNVEVAKEPTGANGVIQGGETALSIIKLPVAAKYIEVADSTNQNVVNSSETAIGFNSLSSSANATFTHAGGSSVTVNDDADYLFFGSLFTQSNAINDNNDRVIPITGFQIDGSGGRLNRGQGAAYNRDNANNRNSGSWGAAIIELTGGQTVELTSQNVGTASGAFPNTPTMQGLSIDSLVVSNDPAIAVNLPITVVPSSTGNVIGSSFLSTFDNDTPASSLSYTVGSVPAGGTLRNGGAEVGNGESFTQDDVNNNLVTFDAGNSVLSGGFDFTVSDGGASESSSFVVNVAFPTSTVTIAEDGNTVEGGTSDFVVTTDAAPVGGDITVTLAFSGSATDGTDYTGVASVDILDGTTSATVNIVTNVDGLFEGTETIIATITGVSGPTVTGSIGSSSVASFLVEDGANSEPTGTGLEQVISGIGNVSVGDIVVTDADADYDSVVTTAGTALFQTNGIGNTTVYSDGRASAGATHDVDSTGPALSDVAGFSVEIDFIPQAADLTGIVQVWEIGGSSNGTSIHLVDGVLHLLSKAGGTPANAPTDDGSLAGAFTDLSWGGDNTIVVPLNGASPVTAGLPARLALVFDIVGNTVKSSVNGSVEATATLTGNDNNNWRGDHSVNFINAGSGTGASNNGTGAFGVTAPATIKLLASGNSAVSSVRFWNESSGNITATSGTSDSITATLTITGWASSADGALSTGSGNGESFSAGVWTVTGNAEAVNTALAGVEFVTGDNTADPTIIGVSIDDGDEDGGGPRTGAILYSETAPNPIYVDDSFTGSIGDSVADCDLGTEGAQSGTIGLNAFATVTGALGAVQPTGSVVINDGDYTTENVTLADTVTLQLTDTAGPVQIGGLGATTTTSIDLQGNTLEVGATGNVGPGIDAIISGSGNFTKVGSALLVFRGVNTYTGTTTILDGALRVGFVNITGIQGELAGDGPVVVTDPGLLEFNVDVDKTISQTGVISGTGSVGTLGDGTIIFDNPGANTFTGGFVLGDGATSNYNGVDQGTKAGFTVVNHNGHLGTGKVLSRGSQLQAGTSGLVIPNDIDITAGGFRCGGTVDYELSGNIIPIDGGTRGYGNYGLEGCDLTISGNIVMTPATNVNFEGSDNRDNGTWTITGDISGPGNVLVQATFDGGVVTFEGNHTYTGTTVCGTGTTVFNGTQTGGDNFNVNEAAILTGSGSTNSQVTVGVNATFNPGAGVGTFTTGDLVMNGTLEVDLDNNTPGIGHDQVIVNGTVTLGGASVLEVSAGGGLTPGTLLIIDNDNAESVIGGFEGLPQGGALDADATELIATIDTAAGDANDVGVAFTSYTNFGQWRVDNYGAPTNSGAGANSAVAFNGLTNLANFAAGLDPTTTAGTLTVDGVAETVTSLGPPQVWSDSTNGKLYFRYTRRADFSAIPLTLTEQFSPNVVDYEDNSVSPTVVATGTGAGGEAIEAVVVEFPLILPGSGRKARFGRLQVTAP